MSQHDNGRYRTVLFDLDHTLLDSDASINEAFVATMGSVGLDAGSALRDHFDRINNALWRSVERGEHSPNDVLTLRFQILADELALDADPVAMGDTFAEALIAYGDLYQGARSLLDSLVGRCQLGLVTNGIGRIQRGRMERLGIASYFEAVTISGEVGVAKPDASIFDLTFDALPGASRESAVMVGDSLGSDILGAQNAGIDTVWFNQHNTAPPANAPTHTVSALADIAPLI